MVTNSESWLLFCPPVVPLSEGDKCFGYCAPPTGPPGLKLGAAFTAPMIDIDLVCQRMRAAQ